MPLDPQAESFLKAAAASNMPPLSKLTPAEARAQVPAAPQPFEDVAKVEQRVVAGPDGDIPVRIYTPLAVLQSGDGSVPLPGVVFFHGGGWVLGTLDDYEGMCRSLANASGCKVVSVDYRLAPEERFPAAVEDAYTATSWVAGNAERLGIDGTRIAVAGDSAGGNLAAAVCLMARDRATPSIAYQSLIYPITDFSFETSSYRENGEGYFLTLERMQWFWKQYLKREKDGQHPYASPLRADDLGDLPPAFVLTAEYDPLRDEGEAYAARLKAAGVAVDVQRCEGMIHGFLRRTDIFDRAGKTLAEIGRRLREALFEKTG